MPEVILTGPAGRLEGRYTHSKTKDAPLALILHPNPQHGGTMNNKITNALFQAHVDRGFSTLRFNFRGVGRSQGVYDEGEGELSDAAAALDWMMEINPNTPYVWVAGFSFGAWIGMQLLMRRPEIQGFITVSPPAHIEDFAFLAPCPTSGLVLHGQRDDIIPRESVDDFVEKLHMQKGIDIDYRVLPDANHFYHNNIDTMIDHVHDHMNKAQGGNNVPVKIAA